MKKRIVLSLAITLILMCLFTISISAVDIIKSESNEFGTVNQIEGINEDTQLTDKTSRVVLLNADGTYSTFPAYYISDVKLQWQGTVQYKFDALNTVLDTSYDMDSIVRLEIMTDSTVINGNGGKFTNRANLVEVKFPKDTQITTFAGQLFNGSALTTINIPASITALSKNTFENCPQLKYVTFDENSSLTEITSQAFNNCPELEKIILPNTITTIGNSAFYKCPKLKDVYFGENTETIGTTVFGGVSDLSNVRWYVSGKFMASYEGELHYNYFGSSYTPKVATIYFTGTLEEAEALKAKATHVDKWNGTGGLKNAVLIEYDPSKNDTYYESDTLWTIVYNYNACKAFYQGVHNIVQEEGNNCCGICSRCNELSLLQNPVHSSNWILTDLQAGSVDVSKDILASYTCEFCQTVEATEEISAMITPLGYTQAENGSDLAYRASINNKALSRYEELSKTTVKYGMLAGIATNDLGTPISVDGEGKLVAESATVIVNLTGTDYTTLEIKITGINKTTALYCNAFAVIGTDVTYICDTASDKALKKEITIVTE